MSKILYLVTEDWYFCSHRLPLAAAAREAGYQVSVATQVSDHSERIRDAGLNLIPLNFPRSYRKPAQDFCTITSLLRVYRRESPDLVHHVSLKPVLYGSMAARLTGVKGIVNALTGLGHIFTSDKSRVRLLRFMISPLLRSALGGAHSQTILQNADDARLLEEERLLDRSRYTIIRGSGVDLERFSPAAEPEGPITVILPARILADKGVREFVAAAAQFRSRELVRFVLVGAIDTENPSAVSREEVDSWQRSGVIEWWGPQTDMAAVYHSAHIVCLPSYREGLPKVLIEAAACGRPLVATDVPGCREVVRHGENGLLVTPRDVASLVSALEELVPDSRKRRSMGVRSRSIVESDFGLESVINATLELYSDMLAHGHSRSA